MAIRPVFTIKNTKPFVNVVNTEFKFFPGLAISQAQKSVYSLHDAFIINNSDYSGKTLEISSRSPIPLGIQLSAFNLQYTLSNGKARSVETVFQAAKCFENGNQYTDLLDMNSYEAKKDERIRTSGNIIAFRLEEREFPIQPTTFFYDWLYLNALCQNKKLADQLVYYNAFTDIAFNPQRSLNCQARSAAIYVSLFQHGLLDTALKSPEQFLSLVYEQSLPAQSQDEYSEQLSLFDL